MCVTTHKGSWVKLLLCLISIVTRSSSHLVMYRSNRSFNMPPRATPRAFDFFEIFCSNSLLTQAKMPFKCPTLGSIQVIKCPHPGDILQAQNDRRTAETPSVVEQNLYKYNKNWETRLAYLLRTKVSCKAAEIAATRSLNAQLFFVMQHTKRCIKKDPTYWDYYIMTISLTCVITHLIN